MLIGHLPSIVVAAKIIKKGKNTSDKTLLQLQNLKVELFYHLLISC